MSKERRFIGDWKIDDLNALVKRFTGQIGGEEAVRAYQRGEFDVVRVETLGTLVDINGRWIPHDLQSAHCDPDRSHRLEETGFNPVVLHQSLEDYFPGLRVPSVSELEEKGLAVIERIGNQKQLKKILNGPHFILGFPQMPVPDYKTVLREIFLEAVRKAYENYFPKRRFINNCPDKLENWIEIVPESRNQLHLLIPEQTVVGVWFPTCFQGFSIDADREVMAQVPDPEKIWLSGAFEAAIAIVGYPGVIARDFRTPDLDLTALSHKPSGHSFRFGACDDHLSFYHCYDPGFAWDCCSSGLFFLG